MSIETNYLQGQFLFSTEKTPEVTPENSSEVDLTVSVKSDSYEYFEEQMKMINDLKYHGYPCDTKIVHSEKDTEKKLIKERGSITKFFASEKRKMMSTSTDGMDVDIDCKISSERLPTLSGAVASAKGRRDFMDDTYCSFDFDIAISGVSYPVVVTALFDGHIHNTKRLEDSKLDCAVFCRDNLESALKEALKLFCETGRDLEIFNALKIASVFLDFNYKNYAKKIIPIEKDNFYGTTALISMFFKEKVWIGNIGDSRALTSNPNGCVLHTYDAKVSDIRFINGIQKREGKVTRSGRIAARGVGVSVCRAFGNEYLRNLFSKPISCRPKIVHFNLAELRTTSSFLILACDGIFDVLSTQEVHEIVQECALQGKTPEEISSKIVSLAYQNGSKDNLTVIVLPLYP